MADVNRYATGEINYVIDPTTGQKYSTQEFQSDPEVQKLTRKLTSYAQKPKTILGDVSKGAPTQVGSDNWYKAKQALEARYLQLVAEKKRNVAPETVNADIQNQDFQKDMMAQAEAARQQLLNYQNPEYAQGLKEYMALRDRIANMPSVVTPQAQAAREQAQRDILGQLSQQRGRWNPGLARAANYQAGNVGAQMASNVAAARAQEEQSKLAQQLQATQGIQAFLESQRNADLNRIQAANQAYLSYLDPSEARRQADIAASLTARGQDIGLQQAQLNMQAQMDLLKQQQKKGFTDYLNLFGNLLGAAGGGAAGIGSLFEK